MYGCEMVCLAPIGSAPAPYACEATVVGTKRCRGTSRMACRIRSSLMPLSATYRCTMAARKCAKSGCRALAFVVVTKDLLERFEPRDRFVVREVEVQRGDGDATLFHRFEVGPFAGMPGGLAAADPVVGPAARIFALEDVAGVDAIAEPRHAHVGEFDREVDVEDDVRIAMPCQRPADEFFREDGTAIEGEILADERGEGDRWNVEQ